LQVGQCFFPPSEFFFLDNTRVLFFFVAQSAKYFSGS
jgi:hypothetical protein